MNGYTGTIAFGYTALLSTSYSTPAWVEGSEPALYDSPDRTEITAAMRCTTLGEVCGVCELSGGVKEITHNQILVGVNSNNVPSHWGCANVEELDEDSVIRMKGMEPGTSYRCSFMCYNSYPVWPGYVPYTTSDPVKSFTVITAMEIDEDDDDFGWALQMGLWVMLGLIA